MTKRTELHIEFSRLAKNAEGARLHGDLYYYTGKPCKRGHVDLRYASSGNCVVCIEQKRGITFVKNKGRCSAKNAILAQNALDCGHSTYCPDRACPKGHFERYVTTHNCVQCGHEQLRKRKNYTRWARIKKIYGITELQFSSMMAAQFSCCKICKSKLNEKNTHIDHCHVSGKVRGLLCSRCNQAIGLLDEDCNKIEAAKQYLMEHGDAKGLSKASS